MVEQYMGLGRLPAAGIAGLLQRVAQLYSTSRTPQFQEQAAVFRQYRPRYTYACNAYYQPLARP